MAAIIRDPVCFDRALSSHLDDRRLRCVGSAAPHQRGDFLAGVPALPRLTSFPEPFGRSMVEAMACGSPLIARPLGAVPETGFGARTGFFVDNSEAAVEAAGRARLLHRRIVRRHVEQNFGPGRMLGLGEDGILRLQDGFCGMSRQAVEV